MWLLFLILSSVYFRCDGFDCTNVDIYRCCINKTDAYNLYPPGHYCKSIVWYSSSVRCAGTRDFYVGNVNSSRYYCCKDYIYTPPRIPVPTPEFTPARAYAKLTVRSHSKTETDLAVTLATAIFQ